MTRQRFTAKRGSAGTMTLPENAAPTPGGISRHAHFVAAALIVAAVILLYGHTLQVPFYLDDTRSLQDNPALRTMSAAMDHLFRQRGLTNLTFAGNYLLSGWALPPLHLTNLVLHAGCGFLAWLLLRRLLGGYWLPLCGALLFVAHPLQTESVTYLVQRATTLGAFLFMLAFLCHLRFRAALAAGTPRTAAACFIPYLGTLLAGAAAVLAKENTATLPLLLIVHDQLFPLPAGEDWRARLRDYLPFFAVPLLLGAKFLLLPLLSGETLALYLVHWDDTLRYLATECTVIWGYLRLLFLPYGQALLHDYPFATKLLNVYTLIGFTGLLALAALAWWLRRRRPLVALGIAWFFLALAVESSIIPLDPFFEHRLYLPLFGVLLAGIDGLGALAGERNAILACALALLVCLPLTWQRNALWNDPVAFYRDNLRVTPDGAGPYGRRGATANFAAHDNLGVALLAQQRYAEAIDEFRKVIEVVGNHADAYNNLGYALTKERRLQEAIEAYRMVLTLKPEHKQARSNLGVALVGVGRLDEAIAEFERVLEFDRNDAAAIRNLELARELRRQGRGGS